MYTVSFLIAKTWATNGKVGNQQVFPFQSTSASPDRPCPQITHNVHIQGTCISSTNNLPT